MFLNMNMADKLIDAVLFQVSSVISLLIKFLHSDASVYIAATLLVNTLFTASISLADVNTFFVPSSAGLISSLIGSLIPI